MKKTIKLLLIFIGGLTALIVAALSGYLLISKNKTYYIYDVRIVKPKDDMSGYIYTDSEAEYTLLDNQTIYMKSKETNLFPIAVYASSSNNSTDIDITSSDKSIALVVYKNKKCYVQFLKEGFVTITSELKGVKDSVNFQIFDQIPSKYNVYDYEYYGEYAETFFPNELVTYADNTSYRYKFELNNISNTGNNSLVDGDLIRIDKSQLDSNVFDVENTYIDSQANELVIRCKAQDVGADRIDNSTIILQSYYYTDEGKEVFEKSYTVDVRIVSYTPEFYQLEVSAYPDFREKVVYTDNEEVPVPSFATANQTTINKYLSAEKEKNYLAKNGETPTHKVYFTNQVEILYVRPRVVYTNGDVVYLKSGENSTIAFSNSARTEQPQKSDYYILLVNKNNYFTNSSVASFNITVKLDSSLQTKVFALEYDNEVNSFYKKDEKTGIYSFNYWDDRARFVNEIYDELGNVIGFGA